MIDALTIDHAAHADIPAVALCSLNWADLFHHHFGHEDWAARVHAEMLAAVPPAPTFDGAERAAHHLAALLT